MHASKPDEEAWRPVVLPPELAAMMRPELPSLADEIIREIRKKIPEYQRPMEGPYGQSLREGVHQALTSFLCLVEDPAAPLVPLAEVCRKLGELEALEGRDLASLQTAYRIGFRVAWHRSTEMGERERLSPAILSRMGEAMFGYLEMVSTLSQEGYLQAKARSDSTLERWRRRLLALILEQPPAPRRAIDELAEATGWTVPDEVTMVALQPGVQWATALPGPDVLASVDDPRPALLLPGPLDVSRSAITTALQGQHAAVGLTVPLAGAADSLRWARHALALADAGIIDNEPLIVCEEHLVTLWLLADEALTGMVSQRLFAGLGDHAGRRQQWLTDTLAAWLGTWGNTAKVAELLFIHPQTVRYRIRKLAEALGDQLDDPDTRFAMDLVLRARQLRERARTRKGPAPADVHGNDQPTIPRQTELAAEPTPAAAAPPASARGGGAGLSPGRFVAERTSDEGGAGRGSQRRR